MKHFFYNIYILFFLLACKNEKKINVIKGNAFGTYYVIKINYAKNRLIHIKKDIDSIVNKINNSLSTYLPTSEISQINNGDSTIITDKMFKKMFMFSDKIYNKTFGYFDPTVGTLRNAYGFGDTKPINHLSDKKIDSMMKFVGWKKVKLLKNGKIKKLYPEIYFDFNAIAKGYAVDLITEYLFFKGIKNLSVEIGGEVRVLGKNIDKNKNWIIGIESINSKVNNRKVRDLITLKNKAIAGSGNYRKQRTDSITGKKYVHTINPLTGKAQQGNILSSYVIANTCAIADGYATAFMAMGIEKSKQILIKNKKINAYLVYIDEKGNKKIFLTKGFKNLIIK